MASKRNSPKASRRKAQQAPELLEAARRSELEASRRAAEAEAILTSVAEGILVYDQDGRIIRSNAAADAILGLDAHDRVIRSGERPASAGVTWFREEGTPLAEDDTPPLRAARFGETLRAVQLRVRRSGVECLLSVSAQPLIVSGARVGALVVLADITERKRREANQALLSAVADDFARLSTEEEITRAIGARLAEHLDISTCTVADFSEGMATITSAFSRPGTVVAATTLRVSDYLDEELQAAARAGKTVVVRDTHTDPRVSAEGYDAMGVRAGVIVPFRRRGEWRHSLAVGCPEPRDWREDQVQVLEEIAGRLFPRIERARAEEAVRRSEIRARTISENIRDLVVILDAVRDDAGAVVGWRYVDANEGSLELLGKRREEVIGRTIAEVLPDGGAAVAGRLERVLATGAPEQYERTFHERTLLVKVFRIAPDRVGTAAIEITERKRAEEALRESEARHRAFFHGVMELAGVHEVLRSSSGAVVDSVVRDANAPVLAFLGTTGDRVVGRRLSELVPAGVVQALVAPWTGVLGTGTPARYEVELGGHTLLVSASRMSADTVAAVADDVTERKRAEAALAASEARLRAMFEDVAVGIVEVDEADRFVAVNGRFCEMLGYGREELLGRSLHEITAPEDRALTRDLNERAHAGELRVFDYEKRYLKRDGSPLWVHVTVSIVRDAAGRFLRAVGTVEDIAVRRRAEEEVRSLAQFPMENPNPVLRASVDGTVFFANEPARLALHGLGWNDGAPLPEAVLEGVRRVVERGTIQSYEVTGEGGQVWSFTISTSTGARHVNLYGRDVTERTRAEAAMRDTAEELARYAALVEHAPVLVRNLADEIVVWNQGMERLYGWPRSEALGKVCHDLLRARFPRPLPEIEEMVKRDGRWEGELVHRHRDGAELIVASTWVLHRDADRHASAIIEIDTDITALKRAQEALREADRRKSEFLGMLSHELRNPLAPIRNSLFILDHSEPTGQQARRARDIASRQVTHLTRLVDDLLDVTRIARGKVELRHEDLDLAALACRTAEDYRPLMQDRGLEVAVEIPRDPVVVNGDPARLTQVLGNLLNNAAKFTPAGGRVTLSLRTEGDRAVVHVIDTGPGIPPEVLPSIFEPFTQGKQTLARNEGGLGLGLSLVKGLVALHGGGVGVTSREGAGTDFAVSLPLAGHSTGEAREGRAVTPAAAATGRRRRVLVVDDNRDAAESLGELVRMFGHDVELAYDGPSALALADRTRPDLVLCDIGLPGMDGYEVAQALRATHDRAVRIVALSGYAQPEDVARALESGFDKHVAKPPDPDKIEALLN